MERKVAYGRMLSLYVLILLVVAIGVAARIAWEMPQAAEAQPAGLTDVTVTRVVDGDTIEVSPDVESTEDVRLIGVNTPETVDPNEDVQPCGPEASAFTEEQLTDQQVGLEFDEETTDRFGRALAYVWLGEELFNETLVREGYAEVTTFQPNDRYEDRFIAAEEEAKEAGINLWDPAGPCAGAESTSEPTTPTTTPDPAPAPELTTPATPDPTPSAPDPAPAPTPAPKPTPSDPGRGELIESGGSNAGPVPMMPGSGCPKEYPLRRAGACYAR